MGRLNGTWLPSTTGAWRQRAATFSAAGPDPRADRGVGLHHGHPAPDDGGAAHRVQHLPDRHPGPGVHARASAPAGSTPAARFEMVLTLSLHPAQGGRPAGQYSLRYRFLRGATAARFTEGGGLVGVVRRPMPANGTTVTLTPETDIRAIWPTMQAIDHCSWLLAFQCTSPRRGVVADVRLQLRHRHPAAARRRRGPGRAGGARRGLLGPLPGRRDPVGGGQPRSRGDRALQRLRRAAGVGAQGRRHPGQLADLLPRHGRPGARRAAAWCRGTTRWASRRARCSSPAEQDRVRRERFAMRLADDLVGCRRPRGRLHRPRGFQPFSQHLALWDTFSRHARWLTGNGVSDDHSGQDWRNLNNGHLTGLWAASTSEADLATALRSGRAFSFHAGRVPGLQLDTLVDDARADGQGRRLGAGARGRSPCGRPACRPAPRWSSSAARSTSPTTIPGRRSWTAGRRPRSGPPAPSRRPVDTASSCFVRPQVRRDGALVATGNPTWLLPGAAAERDPRRPAA